VSRSGRQRGLLLIFVFMIIVLMINGAAYSCWRDFMQIQGIIKVGSTHSKIICYNAYSCSKCCCCNSNFYCSVDRVGDLMLQVECYNVSEGDYFCLYLIVKNVGTVPIRVRCILFDLILGGNEGYMTIYMAYTSYCKCFNFKKICSNLSYGKYRFPLNESSYSIFISRILDPNCKLPILFKFVFENCTSIDQLKFTVTIETSSWNIGGG